MVRVVSCHHFLSQDVFLSESEPSAFCGAQDKLLVSTTQHAINIHDLDARGTVLHSFPTVDIVKQIIYCESGNYVAAIESKSSRPVSTVNYVRVYFKWWIETANQSLKVRIAGCPPATDDDSPRNRFEMVELPLEKPALFVASCNRTSSLAVSLGNTISVFCHSRKLHPTSRSTFQDFEHFMDIRVPIVVQELSVCENHFVCRSGQAVHAFKVMCDSETEQEKLQTGEPVKVSDLCDEHYIEWRFESVTDTGARDFQWENHINSHLDPSSFPIDIHFHAIDKANESFASNYECEFHGPLLTVRGCTVDIRLDSKVFEMFPTIPSNVYAVTLFFRQFVFKEDEQCLSALKIVPFYEAETSKEEFTDPLNAAAQESEKCTFSLPFPNLLPSNNTTLGAIGCFFSTPKEGFLYDLTKKPIFIASYAYTSSMKGIVVENSLLHALTDTGLETYTIHLANSVFQQLEEVDGIKNIVPSFEEVCLLGLRPFLGVDYLVSSDNHLVLASSVEDSVSNTEPDGGSRSTLYSLKEPTSVQIYEDLENDNFLRFVIQTLEQAQAVKKLLRGAPKALMPYAKDTFKDNKNKWSLLFSVVSEHNSNIPEDHPDVEVYSQTLEAILSHLAETLRPEELLALIPQEFNSVFVPHVKRCVEKHQADLLKGKIMSLGQEIKSMMSS